MKKKFLLGIVLFLAIYTEAQWIQIGDDISGVQSEDFQGTSIDLSADGLFLAVSAPYNDDVVENSGKVQVYQEISNSWQAFGSAFYGDSINDRIGYSINLSSTGNILSFNSLSVDSNLNHFGFNKIYQMNAGQWYQLGNTIFGDQTTGLSYCSSLSSDGYTIAIGFVSADTSGIVKVFHLTNNTWTQVGTDIHTFSDSIHRSLSLSLSEDANRIIVGNNTYSINPEASEGSGIISVFENVNNQWVLVGNSITGGYAQGLGYSVDINQNGSRIVVGSRYYELGKVNVFDLISGDWEQVGADIVGQETNECLFYSVSISSDGSRIAAGAP